MGLEERRRTVAVIGARLAVYEYGPPPGPGTAAVMFVHGYPDDHTVFADVLNELAVDTHIIAYDTRNAGRSLVTRRGRASYRLPVLVDDLFAVLDAVQCGPVHLVGHDWGSITGWAAVQDGRAAGRIRSFTSISGPDIGHASRWFRHRLPRPRLWPQAAGQALRSWYVAWFQLPLLPELAWRFFLTRRYERLSGRRIGSNGVRGLALYRANLFQPDRFRRHGLRPPQFRAHGFPAPNPAGSCGLPVQVIVPRRDPFVSPLLVDGLGDWVPRLTVLPVDAGHWWPAEHGRSFARLLRAWIAGPGAR